MGERSRRRVQSPAVQQDESDENIAALDPVTDLEENFVKNYAVDRILTELKEIFHNSLLTQIEQKRDRLLNHKDPEFLSRRDKLRDEYDSKLKSVEAYRTLRNDQLDRLYMAEKSIIDKQFEKEKEEAVERIREAILEKKQALLEELKANNREVIGLLSNSRSESMKEVLEEDAGRLRNVIETETRKIEKGGKPIAIAGLIPAEIEDDLTVIATANSIGRLDLESGDAFCVMEDRENQMADGPAELNENHQAEDELNDSHEDDAVAEEDLVDGIGESLANGLAQINLADIQVNGEQEDAEPKRKEINVHDLPKQSLDITEKFSKAASVLKVGEIVHSERFSLQEAMSSIEIGDPHMDVGMHEVPLELSLHDAVENGKIDVEKMSTDEMIATMDCTIAALATWLNGQCLDQTVFTNILLEEVEDIPEGTLKVFCKGIVELIQQLKDVIITSGTFKEEDFLTHFYADILSDSAGVVKALQKEISTFEAQINAECDAAGGRVRNTPQRAIHDRLVFIYQFLNVTKHFVGYEQTGEDGVTSYSPDFRPNFVEGFEACKACGLSLFLMTRNFSEFGKMPQRDETEASEHDDFLYEWLPAFEPDLNRRHMPAAFPRKRDLMSRLEAFGYFTKFFKKLLNMPTPGQCYRAGVPSLDMLLEHLRTFSHESCILSRSIVQLVVIPSGQKIFGDYELKDVVQENVRAGVPLKILEDERAETEYGIASTLEQFLTDAARCFIPIIQLYGYNIARQRELIIECLQDLNILIQEAADVDNRVLQYSVETRKSAPVGRLLPSPYGFVLHHALSLICYHISLGFQLGLFEEYEYTYIYWHLQRMLYQWGVVLTHRYGQIGEANSYFLLQQERAAQARLMELKKKQKKKKKKNKQQVPLPPEPSAEELRDNAFRNFNHSFSILVHEKGIGLGLICEAMLKLMLIRQRNGQLFVPDNEAERFENRIRCFDPLCGMFHITYENFKLECDTRLRITNEQLHAEIANTFQQVHAWCTDKTHLSKLFVMVRYNMVSTSLLQQDMEKPYYILQFREDNEYYFVKKITFNEKN